MCVCVCNLNNKDTFCLCNFIKILSSFLISVLVSGWNWGMNLPKLSRCFWTFHRSSPGVACMYKECLIEFSKEFFRVFITLQNYVNAESDKTEMLMN